MLVKSLWKNVFLFAKVLIKFFTYSCPVKFISFLSSLYYSSLITIKSNNFLDFIIPTCIVGYLFKEKLLLPKDISRIFAATATKNKFNNKYFQLFFLAQLKLLKAWRIIKIGGEINTSRKGIDKEKPRKSNKNRKVVMRKSNGLKWTNEGLKNLTEAVCIEM